MPRCTLMKERRVGAVGSLVPRDWERGLENRSRSSLWRRTKVVGIGCRGHPALGYGVITPVVEKPTHFIYYISLTKPFNFWIKCLWFLEMPHENTSFCVFSSKKFVFLDNLGYFCKRKCRTGSLWFTIFLLITKVKLLLTCWITVFCTRSLGEENLCRNYWRYYIIDIFRLQLIIVNRVGDMIG